MNTLTATQIVAILFALLSGGYITYLNTKPQLTPHETRTHKTLLTTHQAASRAIFFPTLPPTKGDKKKKRPKAQTNDSNQ